MPRTAVFWPCAPRCATVCRVHPSPSLIPAVRLPQLSSSAGANDEPAAIPTVVQARVTPLVLTATPIAASFALIDGYGPLPCCPFDPAQCTSHCGPHRGRGDALHGDHHRQGSALMQRAHFGRSSWIRAARCTPCRSRVWHDCRCCTACDDEQPPRRRRQTSLAQHSVAPALASASAGPCSAGLISHR